MSHPRPHLRRRTHAPRRGVAAVEFALVLPFLVAVFALTIDFGRLSFDRGIVTNAARLGASVATKNRPPADRAAWEAEIRAQVEQELSQLFGFDPESIELKVEVVEEQGISCARIELMCPFRPFFDWPAADSQIAIRQVVVSPFQSN